MPDFTIETTYHLPVFRHRTYAADVAEDACRLAVADDNWDVAEKDYDSSGVVHVSGIWKGTHAAHSGLTAQILHSSTSRFSAALATSRSCSAF